IKGVGYKAEVKGSVLVLYVGYSHPVEFKLPAGVKATVEKNTITLESINKEELGETAANIRKVRKPEPYKGKGIRYVDEVVLRKAGKQVKTTTK
ncbi:MAG TPA: 50S ribosomal protein L6, partial [Patescibacteria group bacterium]|nr:50S ribosomal protein L6 [Patescibacteria group bacterium]